METTPDFHFNMKLDDSTVTEVFEEDTKYEEMSKSFFNTGRKGSEFSQAVSPTFYHDQLFICVSFTSSVSRGSIQQKSDFVI